MGSEKGKRDRVQYDAHGAYINTVYKETAIVPELKARLYSGMAELDSDVPKHVLGASPFVYGRAITQLPRPGVPNSWGLNNRNAFPPRLLSTLYASHASTPSSS